MKGNAQKRVWSCKVWRILLCLHKTGMKGNAQRRVWSCKVWRILLCLHKTGMKGNAQRRVWSCRVWGILLCLHKTGRKGNTQRRVWSCKAWRIWLCLHKTGSGGFFLVCEDFGRIINHSFPTCTLKKFSLKVEINLCKLIPLFRPGSAHSGSASWADCDQVFLMSCVWARFPDTLCQDRGTVSPLRLCWVKGVWMFRCNLPPALLAEWPGSFKCHCCNTGGGTDTEWESAHKVDSGEENCPAAPARIWTRNLSIPSPPL